MPVLLGEQKSAGCLWPRASKPISGGPALFHRDPPRRIVLTPAPAGRPPAAGEGPPGLARRYTRLAQAWADHHPAPRLQTEPRSGTVAAGPGWCKPPGRVSREEPEPAPLSNRPAAPGSTGPGAVAGGLPGDDAAGPATSFPSASKGPELRTRRAGRLPAGHMQGRLGP